MNTNAHAATSLLGRMLAQTGSVDDRDEPDFSLTEIREEDGCLWTKVQLPTGDTYRVSVQWLSEESP